MEHELKTWPQFYQPIIDGTKTFELRNDDRYFSAGDILHLREYDPFKGIYTGQEAKANVTFVMRRWSELGLKDGYCIMSIANVKRIK